MGTQRWKDPHQRQPAIVARCPNRPRTMANISNRSPWQVKLPGQAPRTFRLKSKALDALKEAGLDPDNPGRGVIKQLETSFEVQITRKDRQGQVVKRSSTHDTREQAEKWAKEVEADLDRQRFGHGGFSQDQQSITIAQALQRLYDEHYATKASATDARVRVEQLTEWLGAKKRFRDITRRDLMNLRDKLVAEYSASSVRNYFTVLTRLYKHADNRWQFSTENLASGIEMPRRKNAIQRDWQDDEQERLMKSLAKRSPWMIPIVKLSLLMAFRRGELVQTGKNKKTGAQSGGLRWEHIDWKNRELRLPHEKNDHQKAPTEFQGRVVPLTKEMEAVLRGLYSTKKPPSSGLVFSATRNSVTKAFSNACEKAEPPIEDLTFHSIRKIATKALSKQVPNAMELQALTGHKSITVLAARYYKVQVSDLLNKLDQGSDTLLHRGMRALMQRLEVREVNQFIKLLRTFKNPEQAWR